MKLKKLITSTALAAIMFVPAVVTADSELAFGSTGTTATANVDFRIVIPSFIYFRVGSAGGTVDRIDYDLGVASAQPGSGTAVAATGGTNDGADGILAISLITNAASVSIAASGGNLTDGTDTIPFADISASNTGSITVPDFGASVTLNPASYSLTDNWTYSYDNTSIYNPATYNGTTTYTLSVL